jgi:hypothetical protein
MMAIISYLFSQLSFWWWSFGFAPAEMARAAPWGEGVYSNSLSVLDEDKGKHGWRLLVRRRHAPSTVCEVGWEGERVKRCVRAGDGGAAGSREVVV